MTDAITTLVERMASGAFDVRDLLVLVVLVLSVALVTTTAYFKKRVSEKEEIIAKKDSIIESRTRKIEEILENVHSGNMTAATAIARLEGAFSELRGMLLGAALGQNRKE